MNNYNDKTNQSFGDELTMKIKDYKYQASPLMTAHLLDRVLDHCPLYILQKIADEYGVPSPLDWYDEVDMEFSPMILDRLQAEANEAQAFATSLTP